MQNPNDAKTSLIFSFNVPQMNYCTIMTRKGTPPSTRASQRIEISSKTNHQNRDLQHSIPPSPQTIAVLFSFAGWQPAETFRLPRDSSTANGRKNLLLLFRFSSPLPPLFSFNNNTLVCLPPWDAERQMFEKEGTSATRPAAPAPHGTPIVSVVLQKREMLKK